MNPDPRRFLWSVLIALGISAGPVRIAWPVEQSLLKDINDAPGTVESRPWTFTTAGGHSFFQATDRDHGRELWRTDGTPGGTELVADIVPGPGPFQSLPPDQSLPAAVGNHVYFAGWDPEHGWELWRTDGTAPGTKLVKDITPGPVGSFPKWFTDYRGTALFTASDPEHGEEIWSSNGTEAGTFLVKDVNPGPFGSLSIYFTVAAGKLFFRSQSPKQGWWVSDGTEAGTVPFDAAAGAPVSFTVRANRGLWPAGRLAFFPAYEATTGEEIWATDGTAAWLVRDLNSGSGSFSFSSATAAALGHVLFFSGFDDAASGVYKSDGTELGTEKIWTASGDLFLTVGDAVYFRGYAGSDYGWELYKTTGATPVMLDLIPGSRSSYPGPVGQAGDRLIFRGLDENGSPALWSSDGTVEGSSILLGIEETFYGDGWSGGTRLAELFVFGARNGPEGLEPWVTDGTVTGTERLRDVNDTPLGSYPSKAVVLSNGLRLFTACDEEHGCELWKSDGTVGGTALVKDLLPGPSSSYFRELTAVGDRLYFAACAGRCQIWASDGTEAGTHGVGTASSYYIPTELTVLGETLYYSWFYASQSEIWLVDLSSSSAEPRALRSVDPSPLVEGASELTVLGDVLYFVGYERSPQPGWGLFKVEADEVSSIRPDGVSNFQTWELEPVGERLFLQGFDIETGYELWKSDGNPDGTVLVKDIVEGTDSSLPRSLTAVGDTLFFTAYHPELGRELWKSDGTEPGTLLVKDITDDTGLFGTYDRSGDAAYRDLTDVNGTLFFSTFDPVHGVELWRSDGTEEGTWVVADVSPEGDSYPAELTPARGTLFFSAYDAEGGRELWQTDGTERTARVADVEPGAGSSSPDSLSPVGEELFFGAEDHLVGHEPRLLPLPAAEAGGPYEMDEGGELTLTATGVDPVGGGLTFDWDLDDDGSYETSGQVVTSASIGPDGPEARRAKLRVIDISGVMALDFAVVDVRNVAPVVDAGPDALIIVGRALTRTGGFEDPGLDDWSATVDYGDGSGEQPLSLAGKSFTLDHVYSSLGMYTVAVSIKDDDGGTGEGRFQVAVVTPVDAIWNIISDVWRLVSAGSLRPLRGVFLWIPLRLAIASLEAGNVSFAVSRLEVFINRVNDYIGAGAIPLQDGQALIDQAEKVILALTT